MLCRTSPVAAGTMRCRVDEQFREEVTYYNVTNSVFNNETNATDVLVTIEKNSSLVLESSTVRSVNTGTRCTFPVTMLCHLIYVPCV